MHGARTLLLIGSVLVAGLLLVVVFYRGAEEPEGSTSKARLARSLARPAEGEWEVEEPPPVEAAEPASKAKGSGFQSAEDRQVGTAELNVLFVDDWTEEPIPDLAFAVYVERPTGQLLGRGRTDERGRVDADRLPENTILVVNERRPPFAATVSALWLSEGEKRDHVVRVKRGGTIRGRVVDDVGNPVAEARIHVRNLYRYRPVPLEPLDELPPAYFAKDTVRRGDDLVLTSDPAGMFEVDHLLSRPGNVWIVDGEARPELWVRMEVLAAVGVTSVLSDGVHVSDGELVDLGDVVLPRDRVLTGTLVREDGTPVVGALVSAVRERDPASVRRSPGWAEHRSSWRGEGPATEGFELRPFEALTDEDGRFELVLLGVKSASRVLRDYARVVTRSLNSQFMWTPEIAPGESTEVKWTLRDRIRLAHRFVLEDGEGLLPQALVDRFSREGDLRVRQGSFRWFGWLESGESWTEYPYVSDEGDWLVFVPEEIRERLQGLEVMVPGFEPISVPLPLSAVSEQRHVLRLRERETRDLILEVRSLAEPGDGKHPLYLRVCLKRETLEGETALFGSCCGLGATERLILDRGATEEVRLPLTHPGPYYVSVFESFGEKRSVLTGPVYPGEETHELAWSFPVVLHDPKKGPPGPPPPSDRPVDSARRPDYISPFSRRDEPSPTRILVVREADGRPAPLGTLLEFHRDSRQVGAAGIRRGGRAELPLALDGNLRVRIRSFGVSESGRSISGGFGVQNVMFTLEPGDHPQELRMAPWVHGSIEVTGLFPEHRGTSIKVGIEGGPPGVEPVRFGLDFPVRVGPESQVFQYRLAPGTYRARAESVLYSFEPIEFEVREGGLPRPVLRAR